jgi:hypothetical protein
MTSILLKPKNTISSTLGLTRLQTISLLLWLAFAVIYTANTGWKTRQHDAPGHMAHVRKVIKGNLIPAANSCWECYHQPLYYWVAAAVIKSTRFLGWPQLKLLQYLSMLCMFGFLYFGCLLINLTFGYKKRCAKEINPVLSTIFVFWPSNIFHSARIGNDCLLYFLVSVYLFFLMRWWQQRHSIQLMITAILAFVISQTKSNGAGLLILTSFAVLVHIIQKRNRVQEFFNSLPASGIIGLGFFSIWYFISVLKPGYTVRLWLPLPKQVTDNSLLHYFGFDFSKFFHWPYISNWASCPCLGGGNQPCYFLNYFLKTMLFGNWELDFFIVKILANILTILFVPILASCIVGFVVILTKHLKYQFLIILFALGTIGSLLYFHYNSPIGSAQDFRLVFHTLIAFICFAGFGLQYLKDKAWKLLFLTFKYSFILFTVISITYNLLFINFLCFGSI